MSEARHLSPLLRQDPVPRQPSFDEDPVVAVFKLGKTKYMEELIRKGHVRMNPVSYFRGLESQHAKSDPHDGASFCIQASGATLSMQEGDAFKPIATIVGPIIGIGDDELATNLYCLHARRRSSCSHFLNLDQLNFGESAVLFLNFDEFLRRLKRSVEADRKQMEHNLVDYVDPEGYNGRLGFFRKFSRHAYQREWRIAVRPGNGEAVSFWLGDLSDIAVMVSTTDRLKLEAKERA